MEGHDCQCQHTLSFPTPLAEWFDVPYSAGGVVHVLVLHPSNKKKTCVPNYVSEEESNNNKLLTGRDAVHQPCKYHYTNTLKADHHHEGSTTTDAELTMIVGAV